jgi:hypothetical protein
MEYQNPIEATLTALLYVVWSNIDADFKAKYRREIWDMVEARVRATANQSSTLGAFASALAKKLNAKLGTNAEEIGAARRAIANRLDRQALNFVRQETAYAILLLRTLNDERRAANKAAWDDKLALAKEIEASIEAAKEGKQ